jgi:hypothetical protein
MKKQEIIDIKKKLKDEYINVDRDINGARKHFH